MKFYARGVLVCGLAVLMAACGGGGGGGAGGSNGSSAKPAEGGWLSFDPASTSITQYEGESTQFKIRAISSRTFSQSFNVGIFDSRGLITTQVALWSDSITSYGADLNISPTLASGSYSTSLEVRLCEDDPRTCAKPMPGSPWYVPLTVIVKSTSNLTALKPVEGLTAWTTYQGNPAHTGFVNSSFDAGAFSRRWQLPGAGNNANTYASAAIENGRVFFVRQTQDKRWELVAVSEDTGAQLWKADLGNLVRVNSPALANGRVYLTSSGYRDSYMWVFDQSSGSKLAQTPMNRQSMFSSAPTVYGNDVYADFGGLGRYSDLDGKFKWVVDQHQTQGWSPATDGRYVYSYSEQDDDFRVQNGADGSVAFSVASSFTLSSGLTSHQVVLTDKQYAIVPAGNLKAYDLVSHKLAWRLDTANYGKAAYGDGTVYAFDLMGSKLEARAPANGSLLWSANLHGANYANVIVTRNLAFVSSSVATAAVDLKTHEIVWRYPMGGNLAISPNGVLYILTDTAGLYAINLR